MPFEIFLIPGLIALGWGFLLGKKTDAGDSKNA